MGHRLAFLKNKLTSLIRRLDDKCARLLNRNSESSEVHLSRQKTRWEMLMMSGAVCGIEFCYAAETAFVSPTLMSLGIPFSIMTTIWCLIPLLGFFLSPLLGSLSDTCTSSIGKRRPFIILLPIGILCGLFLVPNGDLLAQLFIKEQTAWHIAFTIIGTMLLDFCCDAYQSPARTYLLDVTNTEEHTRGLSTFTLMAGLGGSMGYLIGSKPWEKISMIAWLTSNHVRVVFAVVSIIFIICVITTITSFAETQPEKVLIYSIGMTVIGLTKSRLAVICCSTTAGIQYATLFAMPYLVVSRYHQMPHLLSDLESSKKRGIGTDVSVIGSMVFAAQLLLSLFVGRFIEIVGSNVATVYLAALFSLCGAYFASEVNCGE